MVKLVIEIELDDLEMLSEIGQKLGMPANSFDQIIRHSIRDRWLAIQGEEEAVNSEVLPH
jgi:hypothetical protein